jgi:hypothetical protein
VVSSITRKASVVPQTRETPRMVYHVLVHERSKRKTMQSRWHFGCCLSCAARPLHMGTGRQAIGQEPCVQCNTLIASGIQQGLHNMLHALRCKPCGFSSCMKNTHKACNQGMCHNLAQQGYVRTAPLVSSSRCLLERAAGNEMPHIVAHRCIIEARIGKHIESPHSPGHRSYHTMIE